MKCFLLGHKFGKIQSDGYQYCELCGKASLPTIPPKPHDGYQYCELCGKASLPTIPPKPHTCSSGHFWTETSKLGYSGFNSWGEWRDWKVAYTCKNCGETKSEWLFGH